jgi:hypothetical protein
LEGRADLDCVHSLILIPGHYNGFRIKNADMAVNPLIDGIKAVKAAANPK